MFQNLKRWWRGYDRFTQPPRKRPLPQCRIRPYEKGDYEKCVEIYKLNEPGRFPPGYLDCFRDWLPDVNNLRLVSEVAGEIRGVGGIGVRKYPHLDLAALSFGMVHPAWHKQGYGTVMLLARLASLPLPHAEWTAHMVTAGGSERFYGRFGFVYWDSPADEFGVKLPHYISKVYEPDVQDCRNTLSQAGVMMDTAGLSVPIEIIPMQAAEVPAQ